MRKIFTYFCFALFSVNIQAQNSSTIAESVAQQECAGKTFIGEYRNDELKIFLRINLIDKNVQVPKQDILGEIDGYIGSTQCDHVWPIVDSEVNSNTAQLQLINNFGSEDFTATLTDNGDGTVTLKHIQGSTFKFPVNRKWQKIPKTVVFHKK